MEAVNDTPSWGGEAVFTETQEHRDAILRPVGAEPDVEERLAALHRSIEGHEVYIQDHTRRLDELAANHAADADLYHAVIERLVALEMGGPATNDWKARLQSRKFLLALATVIGSILTAVAGLIPPEWAAVITVVSGGIWTLSEAFVDNAAVKAKAEVARAVASLRPPAAP